MVITPCSYGCCVTEAATSPSRIPSVTAFISSTVITFGRAPLSSTALRPPSMPPALK